MRKTSFRNIPVRGDTQKSLSDLKTKLGKQYLDGATYDDIIRILLSKNEKIILSHNELKDLLLKSRGVKWD